MRADSDLEVHLQTVSGRVSTDFEALRSDGHPANKSVWGRLGAGTGRLRASATSGHVALLSRPVDDEGPL